MTNFEKMMPFFVLALALGSIAALFFAFRSEYRLACRKQIKLANYREKNYLFYITRDFPIAVITGFLGAASLAMSVVAILMPVLRIYALPLLLLCAGNAVGAYFSLTRQRYVRDIRIFDAYYVQVADLLDNKEHTLYNMEICRKSVKELHGKLSASLDGFNRNLKHPIPPQFLSNLFAPVSRMVQEYMQEIERFSRQIEEDFDRALSLFLHEEVQPELQVVPLRDFDAGAIEDLLGDVKSSYGVQVAEMVIDQVAQSDITSAVALGNIMTLLHELGVRVDGKTLTRFLRAAAVFSDRGKLCSVLYANKQIPAYLVCEVMIPEGWDWAFAPGMAACYNDRELGAILDALLANDKTQQSYLLLSQCTAAHAGVLTHALQKRQGLEKNAATAQAEAFLLILGNEYAVGNAGSVFENLALMLFDRRTELDLTEEEQVRVVEIVRDEQFLDARREIAAMYTKAARAGEALVGSSTRIFLHYIMHAEEKESFLSPARLAALLGEYRFTLSFGDLSVLRMLVGGWMLCKCKKDEIREMIVQEFIQLPAAVPAAQGCDAAELGRALLLHLGQNDRVRLRSAVYRAESTRRALDQVLKICEKGAAK